MLGDAATAEFRRLVEALRPYLTDVVIVGGWAHQLFELHPLARRPEFVPLTTDDADVAVPSYLETREATLLERLQRANFNQEMSGDDKPPVTIYRLGDGDFYVEFLAPKTGGGLRRSGTRAATKTVQGIVVQKLPHVEVLLLDPWTVELPNEGSTVSTLTVRIPNAVTYLAQKLLVLPDREKDKQDNDVVYIHDTLMIFADSLPQLGRLWGSVRPQLTTKQVRNLDRERGTIFGAVDDRLRRAAIIARETGRGAPPSAEQIRERCASGLRAIFDAGSRR
jgi:nucleotidyltransferase-like protein